VIVSQKEGTGDIVKKTEDCMRSHILELKCLGMIVNEKKTEAIYLNKGQTRKLELRCGQELITTGENLKALGVTFDEKLTWETQITNVVNKMTRLTSGLKFLRKKLTKQQFLKATTSQFFGLMYYGCQVWLGEHTRISQVKRLNSLHYKLLRIAENDWRREMSRRELDNIGRARPFTWSKYATASLVIKTMTAREPVELYQRISRNHYSERRKPWKMKFYNNSKTRTGLQGIENRIDFVGTLDFDHYNWTKNSLRINLKKSLGMNA